MYPHGDNPLLDYLFQNDPLGEDMKHVVHAEQSASGRSLIGLLLDLQLVDEERVLQAVCAVRGCELVSIQDSQGQCCAIDNVVDLQILQDACAVVVHWDGHNATVVLGDIGDLQAQDMVQAALPMGTRVRFVLGRKSDIMAWLHAQEAGRSAPGSELPKDRVQRVVDGQMMHQFLYAVFIDALCRRASDIHFEPCPYLTRVRMRCDGLLMAVRVWHASVWQPLGVQLKILAGMDISQTRLPQDGRFSLSLMGKKVDVRVAVHPTVYGEKIVLRLLDPKRAVLSLDQLGYSPDNLVRIHDMLGQPDGLIVVTGPTGAGKTTSLYSMLSVLDARTLNIMTLEEPVEYSVMGIHQTEVSQKNLFDFAAGMHSVLRQDPDVIVIGEIRDKATAEMAVRASLTGHLVLTSLHTIDALSAFGRLKELGLPPSLLAGVMRGVIAQRLVRVLCADCKVPVPSRKDEGIFQAVGCSACHFSGYKGRRALAEVIPVREELRTLIGQDAPISGMRTWIKQQGIVNLMSEGRRAVLGGQTSWAEIRRVLGEMP